MLSPAGLTLGIVLASWWPVLTAWLHPEARELWRKLIVERAISGAGFDQPWWYYLASWSWQLLPWTGALFLAARGSYARARQSRDARDRFLWCWAILPIVLLSFASGKHHHYIIAALCGLTPLLALGLLRLGTRVTAAALALTIAGTVYAHGWVLPARDPSRFDRPFLKSASSHVPGDVPLAAIGGPEIARHIFYVDRPLIAIWNPADLRARLGDAPVCYVIARDNLQPQLSAMGEVSQVAQSTQTRRERTPADRFTLFRVEGRP
jgi:hypothetical protein